MNVLWITNTILPEASILINQPINPFGGWLVSSSIDLARNESMKLTIAFPLPNLTKIKVIKGETITYIGFSKPHNLENVWVGEVFDYVKPNIIHIHGTEFIHSYLFANYAKEVRIPFVVSIQGLMSVYQHHYLEHIPEHIQRRFMLRDFIKKNRIIDQYHQYQARSKTELKTLELAEHIIGRTKWDYEHTHNINPNITYYKVNETLREGFYHTSWDIKSVKKYSIYCSQAATPIKGMQYLIDALPTIVKEFPDTHVFIGGENIFTPKTLKERFLQTSFGHYIKSKIKQLGLTSHITFLGIMKEEQVIEQLRSSHVFISPSTIENSPNSVGEAMLMGVPTISSRVGGVPDMIEDKLDGLMYEVSDTKELSNLIRCIFTDLELCLFLSEHAKKKARITHNKEKNTLDLVKVYQTILK
ncbi:MAG TPA: glycosyltransferase family 4 protein [Bacilli bacterium]|nr:glycosyltransferase family 4 protein [Bacilli bacterium]